MTNDVQTRVAHVNQLLGIISTHGRRFFYSEMKERTALVWVAADDQVMFKDDYSGQSFVLPKGEFKKNPKGFTHGGTLLALVESLGHYIHTGQRLHRERMAASMGEGRDLWGYGAEAVAAMRQVAYALPIFQPEAMRPTTPIPAGHGLRAP